MALIDPDGMFGGDRMALLSDNARLHWPWFWCASNTVARLELDYPKVIARAYRQFSVKPTEDEFWGLVGEFQGAFLLYVYEREGQIWGQWDTSEKYLQRHKLTVDIRSPAPTVREFSDFKNQYIEDKKIKASSKFNVMSKFGNFPKGGAGWHGVVRGVGVGGGVGGGEGKSKPRASDDALDLVPADNGGLVRSAIPARRGRGRRSTEEIRKALGAERLPWWENFWRVFPCHDGMNEGMDAFERRVTTHELAVHVYKGAQRYAALFAAQPDMKLKYAQGWINNERWDDECALPRPPTQNGAPSTETLAQAIEAFGRTR